MTGTVLGTSEDRGREAVGQPQIPGGVKIP